MSITVTVTNGHFDRTIFNDSPGLTYIWQNEFFNDSKHMLLSIIETTLLSQFKQKWHSDVNNSSKCFFLL